MAVDDLEIYPVLLWCIWKRYEIACPMEEYTKNGDGDSSVKNVHVAKAAILCRVVPINSTKPNAFPPFALMSRSSAVLKNCLLDSAVA